LNCSSGSPGRLSSAKVAENTFFVNEVLFSRFVILSLQYSGNSLDGFPRETYNNVKPETGCFPEKKERE
jgi:hypothetical protein